jgi:hypothetical protein
LEGHYPKRLKTDFAPETGSENRAPAVLLTNSFEKCYVPEVAVLAGVAKLAYAADSKLDFCTFCPLRNSSQQFESAELKSLDTLKPFAGILSNFEAF